MFKEKKNTNGGREIKPARNNIDGIRHVKIPLAFFGSSLSPHNNAMNAPRYSQVPRSQVLVSLKFCCFIRFSQLSLHDDTGVGGNTGPKLSSLLTDRTGDGGSLHLTLGVDDL